MAYKLVMKVREVDGKPTIIYRLRERKRIVKNKLAEAIREFKKEKSQ